jgi:Transcriptional regulator, AbiEi antitoxin
MREQFFDLAARQSGVVTRYQLLELHLTSSSIDRRVSDGLLVQVFDGAYCVASRTIERRQRVIAAVLLCPDAAADASDAAELLGLETPEDDPTDPLRDRSPVQIVLPVERRMRRTDVAVRRQLHRIAIDTQRCGGITVLSPTRLVIDMAGRWSVQRVAALLDAGLRTRQLAIATVARRHAELSRRGRRGVHVVDTLLAERADGQQRSVNEQEAAVRKLLRDAGFPEPTPQYRVRFGKRSRYIDLAYPGILVGLEYFGFERHYERTDWSNDIIRGNELQAIGWTLLYVTSEVLRNPEVFLGQLNALFRAAAAA